MSTHYVSPRCHILTSIPSRFSMPESLTTLPEFISGNLNLPCPAGHPCTRFQTKNAHLLSGKHIQASFWKFSTIPWKARQPGAGTSRSSSCTATCSQRKAPLAARQSQGLQQKPVRFSVSCYLPCPQGNWDLRLQLPLQSSCRNSIIEATTYLKPTSLVPRLFVLKPPRVSGFKNHELQKHEHAQQTCRNHCRVAFYGYRH